MSPRTRSTWSRTWTLTRDRKALQNTGSLKLTADALAHNLVLVNAGDVLTLEEDATFGGCDVANDGIQQRGLARTVGPDQHSYGCWHKREAHIVKCIEAIEADGDVLD
jgi:hypothetical protein